MDKLWHQIKTRGEDIGIAYFILGFSTMILFAGLIFAHISIEASLLDRVLFIGLALISVGLGFTSVGISTNSDKRQAELLARLDKNIGELPLLFKGDVLTPSGHKAVKELRGKQSKEVAQKRLDEDTRKVGYVRGELFQNEDDSWSIHWGGKYPL